jgi:aspartate kinase
MNTLVMKFGGSSVSTTMALTQVLSILMQERERWQRLVLVVSALEGVTDALTEAGHLAQMNNKRGYRRIVANLRTRHLTLIEQLPLGPIERAALQADIDRLLFDMLGTCQALADMVEEDQRQPEALDSVVGVGERLAARIVAALLRQNKIRSVAIDATDLIVTDEVFGNARVNIEATCANVHDQITPMLEREIIPVITGFIGSTVKGKPTTLGRGGSEYTAAVVAVCLEAEEVWMWTDVDGVMTADPREVQTARTIPTLSYDEATELAYFGARVLHPRTLDPLRDQQIALRVCNVFKPQDSGTHIQADTTGQTIKGVTSIQGLGVSVHRSGSLAALADQVDELLFKATGSRVDVMIASQSPGRSFACFVIPTTAGPDALHSLRIALEEAMQQRESSVTWQMRPVTVITAIGAHLDQSQRLNASLLEALEGVRTLALAQGPSNCSLSLVVEPADAERTLQRAHQHITASSA